ncbi:MAG: flagellar FliL protein [Candidatus Azotimanducaceae bacterium]|jgi:flagellar FliL protein
MAEEDEDVDVEEQAAGVGKRKKLIMAGAALLVLLLAVGGGAFWFLSGEDEVEVAEVADEGGLFSSGPGKAIYHKLKPNFVTTFEANSRQRYVQLEVTLVTRDKEVVSAIISHTPLIRNALVMLIAEQDYLELQTQGGKTALRDAAVESVQAVLQQETGSPGIERVLFTEFVMQ